MNKVYTIKTVTPYSDSYKECLYLSTISRNLYNVGLYFLRQSLIKQGIFRNSKELYQAMKANENWIQLPRKVSNQVWKQVWGAWTNWLSALKKYKANPSGYTGRPRMPRYNHGVNEVRYEAGAIGIRGLVEGYKRLSQTNIIFDCSALPNFIVEARIIPTSSGFKISLIYQHKEELNLNLEYEKIAGIDLGLNNLMAVATNQADIPHFLVNGRPLKSLNQHWNHQIACLKSQLPKGVYTSKKIKRLTEKRHHQVVQYLHQTSRLVVNWLHDNQIGVLVIGKNPRWKENIKMGKVNNQNFVMIPHAKLIELIRYKFESEGGIVVIVEESYTSKASALDLDAIPKYRKNTPLSFSGVRVKRGLYRSKRQYLINADINGAFFPSYNFSPK
jgi:IS605 OrfB family transposase